MPTNPDDQQRAYVRVATAIQAQIASGRLQPGERLPSIRDLAPKYTVSDVTIRRALRSLADEGIIYSDTTRGYFVRTKPTKSRPSKPSPEYTEIMGQLDAIFADLAQMTERLAKIEKIVHQDAQQPSKRSRRSGPAAPQASR